MYCRFIMSYLQRKKYKESHCPAIWRITFYFGLEFPRNTKHFRICNRIIVNNVSDCHVIIECLSHLQRTVGKKKPMCPGRTVHKDTKLCKKFTCKHCLDGAFFSRFSESLTFTWWLHTGCLQYSSCCESWNNPPVKILTKLVSRKLTVGISCIIQLSEIDVKS